jgi:hypothetical protein
MANGHIHPFLTTQYVLQQMNARHEFIRVGVTKNIDNRMNKPDYHQYRGCEVFFAKTTNRRNAENNLLHVYVPEHNKQKKGNRPPGQHDVEFVYGIKYRKYRQHLLIMPVLFVEPAWHQYRTIKEAVEQSHHNMELQRSDSTECEYHDGLDQAPTDSGVNALTDAMNNVCDGFHTNNSNKNNDNDSNERYNNCNSEDNYKNHSTHITAPTHLHHNGYHAYNQHNYYNNNYHINNYYINNNRNHSANWSNDAYRYE